MLTALALTLAAAALVVAVVAVRQSATALTDVRKHRAAHDRTHGREDPDPEHHGTSPTVARLTADVEGLAAYCGELGEWATGVERRLPPRPGDYLPRDYLPPRGADGQHDLEQPPDTAEHPAPTSVMRAADRPEVKRP